MSLSDVADLSMSLSDVAVPINGVAEHQGSLLQSFALTVGIGRIVEDPVARVTAVDRM